MASRRGTDEDQAACAAHGEHAPCSKSGEHRLTSNPFWVKSVNDYQNSAIDGLTWEPAWPSSGFEARS